MIAGSNSSTTVSIGWRFTGGVLRTDMSRIFSSDMWSVRGMGVAVRVRQSTLALISLSRSLSLTPNRCSSSTTSRPRFLNSTSFWRRRCVPITTSTLPSRRRLQASSLLLLLDEAREHGRSYREVPDALAEVLEVLLGEDGGGRQEGHLLARDRGLEHGAHRDLGLAVADVAADEPVHRLVALHVRLHLLDAADLVHGLLVGEGRLEGQLPVVVGREGVAPAPPSCLA